LIFTTKILSDRLYAPTFADSDIKRQISTRYSLLTPVVFTVSIMSREILTNNVTETIRSIVTQAVGDIETLPVISEIVGFNPVSKLLHTYICILTSTNEPVLISTTSTNKCCSTLDLALHIKA